MANSKLPDINYALMAQLSYLKWNELSNESLNLQGRNTDTQKKISLIDILTDEKTLSQIKTNFYNDPEHFPSNESIYINPGDEKSKIQGKLPSSGYPLGIKINLSGTYKIVDGILDSLKVIIFLEAGKIMQKSIEINVAKKEV